MTMGRGRPAKQIRDLFSVLQWIHDGDNDFKCIVFSTRNDEHHRCWEQEIAFKNFTKVVELLCTIYHVLAVETHSPLEVVTKTLHEIGHLCLCKIHNNTMYKDRTANQWLHDLNDRQRFLDHMKKYFAQAARSRSPAPEQSLDVGAEESSTQNTEDSLLSDSHPPASNFTPRKGELSPEAVNKKVVDTLNEPLKKLDEPEGWVYAFKTREAKGRIKVGFSTNKHNRFGTLDRHYEGIVDVARIFVPNARRFEQVIHAQYANEHERFSCKCGTAHKEWFRVDEKDLKASMKAWEAFAQSQPYLPTGTLRRHINLPSAGFSKRANRWRKWAKDNVVDWESPRSSQKPSPPTSGSQPRRTRSSVSPSPSPSPSPCPAPKYGDVVASDRKQLEPLLPVERRLGDLSLRSKPTRSSTEEVC